MSILSTLFGPSTPRRTGDCRAIAIGTADGVRHIRGVLRDADRPISLVGAVLLKPEHRSGALGLPVLGTVDRLAMILELHRIDTALVSAPVAMGALVRRLGVILDEHGVQVRHLPTLADQLDGRFVPGRSDVDISRMLDRPIRPLDEEAIRATLTGKRVLITGAGGSIGSELAHIVCRFRPEQVLLMDRSENALFEIDRQIAGRFPNVARHALLHDVVDGQRTLALLREHRPQIIFHAAAHKHVPMMEDHPRAALENNFFGTRAVADAACRTGAERFVMISTDKAVNPSSVMGATKRAAELYIRSLNRQCGTDYAMVRFGNVLGSACSVACIWARQLADGGPITVTDPRMTRYFMTIPEAAALVIQAASLPEAGGRIFVLDMGEPIRIADLAERFVRLHGLEPDRDVQIVCTGVRPGEKLHEELAYDSEDMLPTAHERVRNLRCEPPTDETINAMVRRFEQLRHSDNREAIVQTLRLAIPEMQSLAIEPEKPGASGAAGRELLVRSA